MPRSQTDEPLIQVAIAKNGWITDQETKDVVARYYSGTGILEFASADADAKYRRQCIDVVTMKPTADGTQAVPTGRTISEFAIKGREDDKPQANIPPKPAADPNLGDTTPAVVEWYFQYHPQWAYARYRVFLDEAGNPIRRNVRRKSIEMVDDRDDSKGLALENEGRGQQVLRTPKQSSWEGGPVARKGYIDEFDNQIIARRATCMTFTPNEVRGGFDIPFVDEPTRGIGVRDEEERE